MSERNPTERTANFPDAPRGPLKTFACDGGHHERCAGATAKGQRCECGCHERDPSDLHSTAGRV